MDKPKRAATGRDSEKYIVRFPEGMRNQIADEARKNNRSMNAEIVARLESSFSNAAKEPAAGLIEVLKKEAEKEGVAFSITFGTQTAISRDYEGAYRRGYHQAVAEVGYALERKNITKAEQLLSWVEGVGMEWRKETRLDIMVPPPPLLDDPL